MDIALTPFTNTLPIRRLNLAPGQRQELRVAYFAPPDFVPRVAEQRYTCLKRSAAAAFYRYQSAGFSADLRTDAEGLVEEYPGLWERAR